MRVFSLRGLPHASGVLERDVCVDITLPFLPHHATLEHIAKRALSDGDRAEDALAERAIGLDDDELFVADVCRSLVHGHVHRLPSVTVTNFPEVFGLEVSR